MKIVGNAVASAGARAAGISGQTSLTHQRNRRCRMDLTASVPRRYILSSSILVFSQLEWSVPLRLSKHHYCPSNPFCDTLSTVPSDEPYSRSWCIWGGCECRWEATSPHNKWSLLDETGEEKRWQPPRDCLQVDCRPSDRYLPCPSSVQSLIDYAGLSINLLALLCLTHVCFPKVRTQTRKFFSLSYHNPDSGKYALGPNDAWMVLYWVVIFTGLRAAVMEYILMPLAKAKIVTKRDQARFSEQAWLLVYYSIFWTLGMVMRSVTLQNDTLLTIAVYLS